MARVLEAFLSFFFLHLLFVVCSREVHSRVHTSVREELLELRSLLLPCGPENQVQVISLGSKHLYR